MAWLDRHRRQLSLVLLNVRLKLTEDYAKLLDMKKVLLIMLLVLVPFQISWAMAGDYCQHENGPSLRTLDIMHIIIKVRRISLIRNTRQSSVSCTRTVVLATLAYWHCSLS
jgi:hypothetical protein